MDGYSRYVWVVFLRSKSDVGFHLQKLFNKIECQRNPKITNFISYNRTEFKNQKLNQFYKSRGITHLTTAPYTPQQNPFSERGNLTTITKGRCLLIDSGLNQAYWAEAVRMAANLENLTPKNVLNLSNPYQQWHNRVPTYKHLQPFGYPSVKTNNSPLADLEPSSPVFTSPEAITLEAETRIHEPVRNESPNKEEILPIKELQNMKAKKHYQWIPET
ncbi:hypothetical protein O181_070201 [Austropuccinia psidii MF-1]|uniref:Integrase catalytic domain-containing protein n=1 Tax=Austropuccinia psidii MF-1 TaxID=1389203 RepID=A0A9Q3I5G6_9BASI|nr:hypothetical protein [Austropuccinia psidii MF-1]